MLMRDPINETCNHVSTQVSIVKLHLILKFKIAAAYFRRLFGKDVNLRNCASLFVACTVQKISH